MRHFFGGGKLSRRRRGRFRVDARRVGLIVLRNLFQALAERLFFQRAAYILSFSPPFLEGFEWHHEAGVQKVVSVSAVSAFPRPFPKGALGSPAVSVDTGTWGGRQRIQASDESPQHALGEKEHHALNQMLSGLIKHNQYQFGRVILVLPTTFLHFHAFSLPTQNKPKASKILSFMLAEKMLDNLDRYAWCFSLHQHRNDKGSRAFVLMQSKKRLQQITQAIEETGGGVLRTISSAHLLQHAWGPPLQGVHFQVYVGADEVFVSATAGGHLHQMQHIYCKVGDILKEALQPTVHSPIAVWERLQHETQNTQESVFQSNWTPSKFTQALRHALEDSTEAINRFIVAEVSLLQTCEVRVLGLFSPCFTWDTRALRLRFEWRLAALCKQKKAHWGVLSALPGEKNAPFVAAQQSPTFYRSATPWLGWVKVHRMRSLALAVSLGVWLSLEVLGFGLKNIAQKEQRKNVQAQITHILKLPRNTSIENIDAAFNVRKKNVRNAQEKEKRLQHFVDYDYQMSKWLSQISQGVSQREGMHLKNLYVGREQLRLNGEATRFEDVESVKIYLLNIPVFDEQKVSVSQKRSGEKVAFQIQITKAK